MSSLSHSISQSPTNFPSITTPSIPFKPTSLFSHFSPSSIPSFPSLFVSLPSRPSHFLSSVMSSNSQFSNDAHTAIDMCSDAHDLDRFAEVASWVADAAGDFFIFDGAQLVGISFPVLFVPNNKGLILGLFSASTGPVTVADQVAEESMVSVILENFPSHAIYGEEKGWRCKENSADYVWVLDPIDGTKSFITGKPLFGTLIALLYRGKPILGIIDQPVLRERWIGLNGRKTTLNGQNVSTRTCSDISQSYLYTTSPHLFSGEAVEAFARVRDKVKVPLYGCDCYAYALLASGFVDLVVESGLKPYDFLSLIPIIKGAGGEITDWKGDELYWEASPNSQATSKAPLLI
ncbi:bifunctional phosphatase IMPL2 [Cucumis melo var. makuwa]|uniref:Bifunctional phosphatase IMPL2 n=1 Tax=Cucumis melo var. makuwa TaxID=1194695 RepID=A0A5D3DYY5_CUCMM|nr:bifunctional phosphatase IMPL2 [Cucumis melo var. makuwa]